MEKKGYVIFAEEVFRHIDEKPHALAALANNLSMIYRDLGQLDRARPYAQKAVSIMESLFPHGHPKLYIARRTLEALKK
jgi:hypothetical protein